jgi:AcrR family transcriptional regulator
METRCQVGRVNQKNRTRAALVAAAGQIVEAGRVPSIPDAADAAGISRATAYRYFSNQEDLLLEAMRERAVPEIELTVAGWSEADDAATRLDQLLQTVLDVVLANEATFRAMLRASLDPEAAQRAGMGRTTHRCIEHMLAPVRSQLPDAAYARLEAALTPFVGIEAIVALCNIYGLDPHAAVDVARWAGKVLLNSTLGEARGTS